MHLFAPLNLGLLEPTDSPIEQLRARFVQTWPDPSTAMAVWSDLAARYQEEHRSFHTLRHIAECVNVVDQYAARVGWSDVPPELELALWFHDIVYEPGSNDNEQLSADVFEAWASKARLSEELVHGVNLLILETEAHLGRGAMLAGVMCDCDLTILGSSERRYAEYARTLRSEFSHCPDWKFRLGRASFLRQLLKRNFLYTAPVFENAFESRARANIQAELSSLQLVGGWF